MRYVSQAGPELTTQLTSVRDEEAAEILAAAKTQAAQEAPELAAVELMIGDPAAGARQEFINVCETHNATMLVMGADVSYWIAPCSAEY